LRKTLRILQDVGRALEENLGKEVYQASAVTEVIVTLLEQSAGVQVLVRDMKDLSVKIARARAEAEQEDRPQGYPIMEIVRRKVVRSGNPIQQCL
jgi:hypothetical protein